MTADDDRKSLGSRIETGLENLADCSDWCLMNPSCSTVEWSEADQSCLMVDSGDGTVSTAGIQRRVKHKYATGE